MTSILDSDLSAMVQLPFQGQNQNPESHYGTNPFLDRCIQTLFLHFQSESDWESIGALACTNKHYNRCAFTYWNQFDLKRSHGVTVLDAKTQEILVDDEPYISKLAILKWLKDLSSSCLKSCEGLTLLTMAKGLTLNELIAFAAEEGMMVEVRYEILKELGDVPVEQTYVILITNSVFMESRHLCPASQKECVIRYGCKMPTVQEYVALCVFTKVFFKQCLYRKLPLTYGCSSTCVGNYPLAVGGCSEDRLYVFYSRFKLKSVGVGGRWRVS